jgi:hypothetical protein
MCEECSPADYCLKLTQKLVCMGPSGEIEGWASWFYFRPNNKGNPYLISAAHAIARNNWCIETNMILPEKECVLNVPINGAMLLERFQLNPNSKGKELDVSWSKIDLERYWREVAKVPDINLRYESTCYDGPLDQTPIVGQMHIYVANNHNQVIPTATSTRFGGGYSTEFEMQYTKMRDDGLLVFKIPQHKGDDYYRGASGAPIVDLSTTAIVAILVSGEITKNELYGYPMANVWPLIQIAEDAERRTGAR